MKLAVGGALATGVPTGGSGIGASPAGGLAAGMALAALAVTGAAALVGAFALASGFPGRGCATGHLPALRLCAGRRPCTWVRRFALAQRIGLVDRWRGLPGCVPGAPETGPRAPATATRVATATIVMTVNDAFRGGIVERVYGRCVATALMVVHAQVGPASGRNRTCVRVRARSKRSVEVRGRGIIVVSPTARSSGRWLDATRATSLQRVANRPIICHVLDALTAAGVVEVAVLVPPDLVGEITTCIASEGPAAGEVRYLTYDCQTETAAALRAVTEFAGDAPTIVHRADGLLDQPLAPFLEILQEEGSDMVVLVAEGACNAERLGPAAQQVLRVAELDPARGALGVAGVCVLGPGAFEHLRRAQASVPVLELGPLVESLIARDGGRIQVRIVRGWRAFAGDALDLLDMNRAMLDALEDSTPALQTDGNRFEGRVFIDATASVMSSVICGPVIVGAGAHVADSYIGPHTSIGERVHVEGAEIERSIVLAGASILHVGGRLVASVVGRDARIFRDFSMPRAMRLQVGDGDEVALC